MGSLNLDRMPGAFDEDTAHTSGDRGLFVLAVQTASEGAIGNDGDYVPFQVDGSGRLRVVGDLDVASTVADDDPDTENPLKVGSHAIKGVLSAISDSGDKANLTSDGFRRLYVIDAPAVSLANGAASVDNVAPVALYASGANMTGRTRLVIQNRGTNSIYLGGASVTSANGIELDKKASMFLEIGDAVTIYGIGTTASAEDVRVMELG